MDFYVGCPIWAYKGWVGNFYPTGTKPSDYLRIYAQQLTTIEGNTTFYAVPAETTLQKWVEETPPTFRFCPKIPRDISHTGKLVEHIEEAGQFVETMSQLGERLGPMFLQLPPYYSPAMMEDLHEFLANWPARVRLAVEVRHLDWFDRPTHEALQSMLAGYQMARVIIDTRPIRGMEGDKILKGSVYERLLRAREQKPNLPVISEPTAPFTFLRYIGHPRMEYNLRLLEEWADTLAEWLQEGRDTFVFCHCPAEILDPAICRDLHQRVAVRVPIKPLPQVQANSGASQSQLL